MKLACLGTIAGSLALALCGVATPAPGPPAAKETPATELARLTGRWTVVSRQQAGMEVVAGNKNAQTMTLSFTKEGGFAWEESPDDQGKIARIDPTKNPKEIDYLFTKGAFEGMTQKGIYKFEGDTFTDCCTEPGGDRPTEFKSTKDNGYEIMVVKRIKKAD